MEQYIGLDVSLKDTSVSVRQDGKRIWRGKCASDPKLLAEVIRKRAPQAKRIVFETGPLSVWFYHALMAEGLPAICIDARHAKAHLDMAPNKTDANDADGLAHLAEVGFYREVRVKGFDSMLIRTLVAGRRQLLKMQIQLSNQIRGLMKTFGLVVLMSRCRNSTLRDSIWTRVAEVGLDVYLDVTRFGSDIDHFEAGDADAVSKSYLSDLLRGIIEPAEWYLEPLAPELFAKIADGPTALVGVQGLVTEEHLVTYGFFPADEGQPNLRIGAPKTRLVNGVHLDRVVGADNARALGFSQLRDALATVIRHRRLEGGPLWWNERLLGRLRYVLHTGKVDIPLNCDFKALVRFLMPQQGKWGRFDGGDRSFNVSEMLDDIERLREHGWRSLDPWWDRLGGEPMLHDADPALTTPLLNEYWRRSQRVFEELVEHSVPRLAHSLRARFKSSSSVTVPCSSADEHADRSDHSPGG